MTDHSGKTLGQYQIREIIGKGGMAIVYRAHQSSMKRDVAIKVMSSDLGRDPDFVERFTREAELFAVLQHPHILPVIDFGHEGSAVFIVMRLVEGGSLDERIKRTGKLDLPLAARMLEQIGGALSFAHDKGIVHRDLKPNNVLLDAQSNTYLTDFGIAKMLAGTTKLTATNAVLGTPAYMAPEQWRGDTIDARTDIYSMGVMAYEMVTGRLPFEAETSFTLMYKHFNDLPPEEYMAHLPLSVKSVILKALMKDQEDRFNSASDFGQAFRGAVEGRPINLISVKTEVENDRTFVGVNPTPIPLPKSTASTDQYTAPISKPDMQRPTSATIAEPARSNRGWLFGLIAVLLLAAAGAGIFFFTQENEGDDSPTSTPTETATNTAEPSNTPTDEPQNAFATILSQRIPVRSGPGTQYPEVFVLLRDTTAEVLAVTTERDWYQINVGGEIGWIPAESMTLSGNTSVVEVVEKPSPTPTPTNTPTDTPTATPTDTPTPTNTPTDTPTLTSTPSDTPTETPSFTPTTRPSNTPTHTPDVPVPFTPTPTVGGAGTEIALEDITPQMERDTASLLPFRTSELIVDNFDRDNDLWEGGVIQNGDLLIDSQGEFAGTSFLAARPMLRDFYLDVTFLGSSDTTDYAFSVWFRTQASDNSGYVLTLDNNQFLQLGYNTPDAKYERLEIVSGVDVDFTRPTRLSVLAVSNFLEVYVNDAWAGTFPLNDSNRVGTIEIGVYTFEATDPTVTAVVQRLEVFEVALRESPAPDDQLYLGEIINPVALAVTPNGNITPRRLERSDLVWVLGRGTREPGWVYAFAGKTFGWLPAQAVDIQLAGQPVSPERLPPLEINGLPVRDFGRFIRLLAELDGGTLISGRVLEIDRPLEDTLATNEIHEWRFTAEAGNVYIISMDKVGAGIGIDPYLTIKDAGGNVLVQDDDSGGNLNALVRFEAQQSGEYIAEARSVQPMDTGSYRIEIKTEGEIVSRVIILGETAEDTITPGEIHTWQLSAQAGETYTMTMERVGEGVDPYLVLKDANGVILAENDDGAGNLNAQIVYEFANGGEYFIDARSYDIISEGSYQLTVTADGQVLATPNATPVASDLVLTIGEPQQVPYDATQIDVWQFEAEAGQTYIITMNNASGNIDPRLTLKDAAGNILAENDDQPGSFNSRIEFTPAESGTYFVEATSFSPSDTGEYLIQVVLSE